MGTKKWFSDSYTFTHNTIRLIYEETYDYLFNNCNFGYNFQIGTGAYIYRDLTHEEWVEAEVYLTKLEELFMTFGKDILYNIEIKADGDAPRTKTADLLVELIEEYDLQDYVLVATNFEDISLYIIENYPNIMMSASHAKAQESILKSYSLTDKFLKPNGYYALQIPVSYEFPVIKEIDLANKFLVSRIQKHNMAVHYWTINDATTMRYLISIGANGIITDDPELLMDIITE